MKKENNEEYYIIKVTNEEEGLFDDFISFVLPFLVICSIMFL